MRVSLAFIVVMSGCSIRAVGSSSGGTDESGGETGLASSETGVSTTTSPTTTVGEVTGDPVTTMVSDTVADTGPCADENDDDDDPPKFDVGPEPPECDLFAQDCDAGFKCVPDQGIGTRNCVPIEDPTIPDGDACTSSFDSDPCGPLSWCHILDGNTDGVCVPLCTGSWREPMCADGLVCIIDDEDITAYCDTPCDPFDPDACGQWTCQPTPYGFGCLPGGSNDAGGWCSEHDSCTEGLVCADVDEAQGCCHGSCCAPACDDAHPCLGGGCTPLSPPVPGAEDFGYCIGGG